MSYRYEIVEGRANNASGRPVSRVVQYAEDGHVLGGLASFYDAALAEEYVAYLYGCDVENLDPLTPEMWCIHGCPESPL